MITTLVCELSSGHAGDTRASTAPAGGLLQRTKRPSAGITRELLDPLSVPALMQSGPCVAWVDLSAPTEDEIWRAAEALRIDAAILRGGATHVTECRAGREPPRARVDVFAQCYRVTVPVVIAGRQGDGTDVNASGDAVGEADAVG